MRENVVGGRAEEERGKCWRWGWWATGSFSYSTNASLWLYLHWEIIWLMTFPCILWVRSTGVIILSHSRSDHSANLDNSTFKNIFTNTTASPLVWATFLWLREPPPGPLGWFAASPPPYPSFLQSSLHMSDRPDPLTSKSDRWLLCLKPGAFSSHS